MGVRQAATLLVSAWALKVNLALHLLQWKNIKIDKILRID